MLGLGGLSWNWIRLIFVFLIFDGLFVFFSIGWFRIRLFISLLFLIVFLIFLMIWMFLRLMLLVVWRLIVLVIELIVMGLSRLEYCDMILEEREVFVVWRRDVVLVSEIGWDMLCRILIVVVVVCWKVLEMMEGWMFLESRWLVVLSKLL